MKLTKKIYLFANWKMYLNEKESLALSKVLAKKFTRRQNNLELAIFPDALSWGAVRGEVKKTGIKLGAQNAYWVEKGGYTGETSFAMYKSSGASYVLIGHSERRHVFHETNHDTGQKMTAALVAGLTPILCVGETLREKNEGKAEEAVEAQLRAALDNLDFPSSRPLIVAYEPVWSVGTGEACGAVEAEAFRVRISAWVKALCPKLIPVILYGGSVRSENVLEYLNQAHFDGVLVGGASTKADSWLKIIAAAQEN